VFVKTSGTNQRLNFDICSIFAASMDQMDPRVEQWRRAVWAGSLMRRLEGTWIFLIIYYKINL